MARVSTSTAESRPAALLGLAPATAGIACCVVSTLGYSAANIIMGWLSKPEMHCDPAWATCNKEMVTVLVVGPWLVAQALRGLPTLPKGRPLVLLVLAGLATQLGGNAPMQWAYGVAGVAVMVPALFAFMLTAVAILGKALLGEEVSLRTMAAIGVLFASLALLGVGAGQANPADAVPAHGGSPWVIAAAVTVACLAGVIYALLSITIRHCVTGTTRLSAVVVIITGIGALTLAPLSVARLGITQLAQTPPEHFGWMTAAGLCNLVAFLALTRGLQLISAVHVNLLNAAQVALSAAGGMLVLGEPRNAWLVCGIVLTIVGIFTIGRPASEEAVDQHV
jgi:drug/metabolite transporter (DMT)-like permease